MTRILLVDADSAPGFPNLALMKISAHHKARGDRVTLIRGIPSTPPLEHFDFAYMSLIFEQNRARAIEYLNQLGCPFDNGGSGFDLKRALHDSVEHIMPDYALYGVDFSMGFTSRGCIRQCGFCVVPQKEGRIRDNAPVSEFHYPEHTRLVLLDNNLGASPRWRENLRYVEEHDLMVNFNQGLDIRIMSEEFAAALAGLRYYGWHFKTRGLHFAFDSMGVEEAVVRGVDILSAAGIPRRHLMFYVLVGYDTKPEEDLYRVERIKALGAIPYIQRYNRTGGSHALARWVNRRYYQFMPFVQYHDHLNEVKQEQ